MAKYWVMHVCARDEDEARDLVSIMLSNYMVSEGVGGYDVLETVRYADPEQLLEVCGRYGIVDVCRDRVDRVEAERDRCGKNVYVVVLRVY